jgi:DnaK suppressor protein
MIDEDVLVENQRQDPGAPAAVKYEDILSDLQRQRTELLREASRKLSSGLEVESYPDLNDQATAEVDHHFALSLKERDRALLQQIDEALDRMVSGRYGICEECLEEIPYKRLKARPMTTLCVPCKTRQEEDEKIRQ